jgi:hypothetical protein
MYSTLKENPEIPPVKILKSVSVDPDGIFVLFLAHMEYEGRIGLVI